jgi:hypothetical protein
MDHAQEIFYMVFVQDNQPPEVLKPGKQALHLPPIPIASQFPSFTMRCNHFNTTLVKELFVQFVAVVCLIYRQSVY